MHGVRRGGESAFERPRGNGLKGFGDGLDVTVGDSGSVGFTLEWALDQFEAGSIVATYLVSNFSLVKAVPKQPIPQEAAAVPHQGRRVALIIANSAYKGRPLANPKVDAGIVAPALTQAGFDVTTVIDANQEMWRFFSRFRRSALTADH